VRCFCARNPDIFHYEVEEIGQIAKALEMIARVKPKVLVINGGDGTVQAALTELYHGGHFDCDPPPVAVLPNGKTNLIALDLGAQGDPIVSLERILGYAKGDLAPHIVERELIALSDGSIGARPVLGMFLGGAGLAETILYCRNKIYPLGLPNGVSHFLAAMAALFGTIFLIKSSLLPRRSSPIQISLLREGVLQGSFSVLIVTTLEKLLLGANSGSNTPRNGHMKFMAVDQGPMALMRLMLASLRGKLGQHRMTGVHIEQGDTIQIDGDRSSVILDGEVFEANFGHPILLRSTAPVPFLRIAA
jgi:Diacylglycerol kinase catalytic domain